MEPNITPLPFPEAGLEASGPQSEQRPMTAADAQNVRSYDPGTDRLRGARRAGLSKLVSQRVGG